MKFDDNYTFVDLISFNKDKRNSKQRRRYSNLKKKYIRKYKRSTKQQLNREWSV